MTEELTEQFSTVPLFEGLDHREIASLLRIAEDVIASPGDEIVRQGTAGDGFFVISAGKFDVLKAGRENKVLARLGEFSYFGEMTLVTNEERSASVICTDAGRLKKFSAAKFSELLDSGDLTAYKVIRNMARILAVRLKRSDDRLVS